MAQDGTTAGGSSYTLDNVTFPVGRTKLQSIFDAIRSTNIGNTAPDLVAGQFWIDNNTPSTTVWTMYFYDGTDSIQFATIDTINNTVNFIDSTFDLINDTTPQLGGNLDLNSNNITGTGDVNITGSITATSFSGDGSALTGLPSGDVVDDTTPQLGGNLDTNGNDINFGDNDKAVFGAGSDLQIYHDGSHSFISDQGTGNLKILAQEFVVQNSANSEGMIKAFNDGAVELRFNNSRKFQTTSTGIDVTGNVTATSYFGDGSNLTGITTDATAITDNDGDTKIQSEESADEDKLRFDTAGSERAVMDSNGLFFTTNGGFVAHHNDISNDMSLTNQNMMLAGSVTISGTLTIGTGSTVVII